MKPLNENLRKRELELQRLIRQMKLDQLHNSKVYRNLEQELENIKAAQAVALENTQNTR
jgi:hypothetical protein